MWGLCLVVQLLPSETEVCNAILTWQHRKHWKVKPVLCRPRQVKDILSTHLCSQTQNTTNYKAPPVWECGKTEACQEC